MFKEKIKKLIERKEADLKALKERSQKSEDVAELRSLNEDIDKIVEELNQLKELYGTADEPAPEAPAGEPRKLDPIAAMRMGGAKPEEADGASSMEYRKAFQAFVATGKKSPELRASTKTSDISAAVPTNLLNQILEKFEQLGVIYNLVTKTSYPVGQTIPVDGVKPTATWVAEGAGSTPVSKTTSGTVTFSHYKLRCEVRMTEEVAQMALSAFEALFVKQVSEAMLRAIEGAIVSGNGTSQPKGILTETAPEGQAIKIAAGASNKITYQTLCDAEAAVPVQYEATAKWCMTKKTFMKFVGMTDSAGQPIARVNYGISGKPERTLLGRDVVLYVPQAGSKLGNYEDAATSDILFAFICDFGDYVLNTNYDLGIASARDWDTEDHKTKAVAAYDGKLIMTDSLVTLTKTKTGA